MSLSGLPSMRQQKVSSLQLEVYMKKIKEYRVKVDRLETEIKTCKTENEALMMDLKDCKTKIAVLEENKAQLSMELIRERKRQNARA